MRASVVAVVVTFAWCVLVVLVLYWAQAVLVPIALAILLTFLLAPPVTWLQRWVGRIPAVLAMVTLLFTLLGLAGWGLARQTDNLAQDLPRFVKRLRAAAPDVKILVGRWAPSALADESTGAAARYRRESCGLDTVGDSDLLERARGDSADSSPGGSHRARCVAAWSPISAAFAAYQCVEPPVQYGADVPAGSS